MIIKISSHKKMTSFKKLLNYMIHDKERLYDKHGKSFAITHNLKGDSIDEWVRQYSSNEECRINKRIDSVVLSHEIISFHKDDAGNISLDKLEDIAKEYIQKRGEKGMFVAVPHFDRSHYHVHLCVSGIEYQTGKSMRLSKISLHELKKKLQEYQVQKYPELSKSLVNYEKKSNALSDKEYNLKKRTGRASNKELLIGMLKTCYKKAISKDDFFLKIRESGLITYIRGGKVYGIVYSAKRYRFSTVGFTEERINELNKSISREKEMGKIRQDSKDKIINRNR
jgi:hypothetical protein